MKTTLFFILLGIGVAIGLSGDSQIQAGTCTCTLNCGDHDISFNCGTILEEQDFGTTSAASAEDCYANETTCVKISSWLIPTGFECNFGVTPDHHGFAKVSNCIYSM